MAVCSTKMNLGGVKLFFFFEFSLSNYSEFHFIPFFRELHVFSCCNAFNEKLLRIILYLLKQNKIQFFIFKYSWRILDYIVVENPETNDN